MRASIALLAVSAVYVAAQTSADTGTLTSKDCDAANIVNTCIASTQGRIDSCDSTDYDCLCSAFNDRMTCWNNCPGSDLNSSDKSFQTSYCNIANQNKAASSSSMTSTMTKSSKTSATTSPASTTDSSSASSNTDSSSSTSSGFAGAVTVPAAGSLLAIVLGVFGMM